MGISSIKISNLLSFDELIIDDVYDINCFVGRNNTGKSNLMKLIEYFYDCIEGRRRIPPKLFSNYNTFGSITIGYDTSRIRKIVTSPNRNKSVFFKHIYNVLFKDDIASILILDEDKIPKFELTLKIHSNDSISWSKDSKQLFNIISYLYPFFKIETRHIDLYDWDKLWYLISKLKSFNVNKLTRDEIVEFFDTKLTEGSGAYSEYLSKIQDLTETSKYSYREKVLNYVKTGLQGHNFLINGEELNLQSDGTNSHKYVELFCNLLITLTRRDYITPTLYVDEPEIGLHPKKNEELVQNVYKTYSSYKKTRRQKQKGKYKTPYPKIIFSTHSPNIVKHTIKLFDQNQQILHFSKDKSNSSIVKKMNSKYDDKRFLNVFNDNEARLFFSDFILFVEGQTELELFNNKRLIEKFEHLKKIDVYLANDNVLSEHINPSYSNTSIPYIFLFDLDKLIDITKNGNDRKIILKNNGSLIKLKGSELNTELKKYHRGYSRKYLSIYRDILKIKDFDNKILKFDNVTFTFKSNEFVEFLSVLKRYLSLQNVFFIKTTIEGSLININAKDLFFKWLKIEYKIKNLENKIANFQKGGYGDEDLLIKYLRILFGGKFEVLVKYSTIIKGKQYNLNAFNTLKYVENNIISSKNKTSGWVTSFINFAIDEIDKERGEISFNSKFREYFPELDEIIQKTKV